MKVTYQLQASDLKAAIEMWMAARGTVVTDADDFTVEPDGTVTIMVKGVPVVTSPLGTTPVVTSVPAPTVTIPLPGHMVTVDPPLSVTGKATMFGLNWDKSEDTGDQDKHGGDMTGFFIDPSTGKNYVTHNKTLAGCSLPREVLLSTFLKIDSWKSDGIDAVWSRSGSLLCQWVAGNKPLLTIDSGGLTVQGIPLVDAGPSANTGNAIDLTYATAHALNTNGDATATYMILVAGQPVPIRGWDSTKGCVG
jgi:hypothetical protein